MQPATGRKRSKRWKKKNTGPSPEIPTHPPKCKSMPKSGPIEPTREEQQRTQGRIERALQSPELSRNPTTHPKTALTPAIWTNNNLAPGKLSTQPATKHAHKERFSGD